MYVCICIYIYALVSSGLAAFEGRMKLRSGPAIWESHLKHSGCFRMTVLSVWQWHPIGFMTKTSVLWMDYFLSQLQKVGQNHFKSYKPCRASSSCTNAFSGVSTCLGLNYILNYEFCSYMFQALCVEKRFSIHAFCSQLVRY